MIFEAVMQIHIVQKGDTLSSIAKYYGIPMQRLESDNDLPPNYNPNIGQALIISYPEQTHIVKEGDTLLSIAEAYNTTPMQVIKFNPFLSVRENYEVNPGEELAISYILNDKAIQVNGFTTTVINQDVLFSTLPSLTYLTILNYHVLATGDIIDINDTDIISTAKAYGVAPIMFVSSMNEQGKGSYAVTHSITSNPEVQKNLINNILAIVKNKGYFGVNIGFYNVLDEDLPGYVSFIKNITDILNNEGYIVFVTSNPTTWRYDPNTPYNFPYYSQIGNIANYVILMTYLWQTSTMAQFERTSPTYLKQYLDFVITQIPPEKIFIGLSRVAYDWELPYADFETRQTFLTNATAISLANQLGAEILFDERTQTPYFNYNNNGVDHLVWFKDARTNQFILNLINEYNLKGLSIWNILYYFGQTWIPIYSQYDIENVLDNVPSEESI
jgi:spore germination protein